MSRPPWLEYAETPDDATFQRVVYPIDKITETIIKIDNGWLVLDQMEYDIWLKFAVLEFVASDVDGRNQEGELVFWGEGPSGNLRECRHTYWGDGGYCFYPSGVTISAALARLADYFDDMVKVK